MKARLIKRQSTNGQSANGEIKIILPKPPEEFYVDDLVSHAESVLKACNGNVATAARRLGLSGGWLRTCVNGVYANGRQVNWGPKTCEAMGIERRWQYRRKR